MALFCRTGSHAGLPLGPCDPTRLAASPLGYRRADQLYHEDADRAVRGQRHRLGALLPRPGLSHRSPPRLSRVYPSVARILPRAEQGPSTLLCSNELNYVPGASDRDRSNLRGTMTPEDAAGWITLEGKTIRSQPLKTTVYG